MTHRWLPWALASVLALPYLLAATWDAAFEAIPPNTESVSLGDDAIRNFKLEVRERLEEEHCFGSPGTGCPTVDNGMHREGSARGFVSGTKPANLNNPAATAIGANHEGLVWLDSDGADNVDANNDDDRIGVWDGTDFKFPRWEALSGINLTAIANGEILKYDGTNLVDQAVATLTTLDSAAGNGFDQSFVNGTCAVDCTVAADVIVMSGGSDNNGYPEVTVPAAPAGVVWDIFVQYAIDYRFTSSNSGPVTCAIMRDINDTDTFLQSVLTVGNEATNNNGDDRQFVGTYSVLQNATAGSRYAFRIQCSDSGAGTTDFDVNINGGPYSGTDLLVYVKPRTIF